MDRNDIWMDRRGLRRAGALVVGVVLAACSGSNDTRRAGEPEHSTHPGAISASTAKDPHLKAWHEVLSNTRPPKTGCFQTSYPSTDWVEVPCVPAPERPFTPPPFTSPGVPEPSRATQEPEKRTRNVAPPAGSGGGVDTVGNGTDWFALLSGEGQIWKATGSFPSVSSGIALSTPYSIQLNTNVFKLPYNNSLCGPSISSCEGAQQATYSASTGGLNFDYVLFGAGSSCPSGWTSFQGSCYLRSQSVPGVPLVGIADLSNVEMAYETGTSDWLMMTIDGHAYSGVYTSVLGVSGWNSVQFGVYGDDNGHQAVFTSSNTSIVANIETMTTGGTIGCSKKAGASGDGVVGSTTEYNNLTLIPNCCLVEGTGISFQESLDPTQACSVCGGQGQACCSAGTACSSASDVCYGQTCTHCGGDGEPCCAGYTCTASGVTCQQGACGQPNVLAASPSALSVEAGDGSTGANTALTYLEASGYWAGNGQNPPSLTFEVIGVPPGVPMPASGQAPAGLSWGIANDVNPPTVQFTAAANTTPGLYVIAVTGSLDGYQATADVDLTVGACQPITCAQAGWVCGSFDNECGQAVSCGTCPSGEQCTGGACVPTCNKYCAPPEFLNSSTCQCEGCPCGYVIVGGHRMCAICKP